MGLGNWLQTLSLSGQDSRNRTKFVEMLAEEVKENEATRLEILKKYAVLDDKGEPVMVKTGDGKDHYDIPDDKLPEFQTEFIKYLNEDFVCGGVGLKTRLQAVKEIVLNTKVEIDPQIAGDYDSWCDAFDFMTEDTE